MARHLANLTNGQLDEKGIFRLIGTLLTQSGVIQSGALPVTAQDTPDMTVKVAGAVTGHDIVFITSDGSTYHGWNTSSENVTITSNASGVTKTDAIVAYADLAAGISTSNNPGALKFMAVRRSGSNTGNPTSGEISSAVSSNPYVVLAYVTVSNGASSINSGNITDARTTRAQLAGSHLEDKSVTAAKVADFSVITDANGWRKHNVPGLRIYSKKIVNAVGFTSVGNHYIWGENLPSGESNTTVSMSWGWRVDAFATQCSVHREGTDFYFRVTTAANFGNLYIDLVYIGI